MLSPHPFSPSKNTKNFTNLFLENNKVTPRKVSFINSKNKYIMSDKLSRKGSRIRPGNTSDADTSSTRKMVNEGRKVEDVNTSETKLDVGSSRNSRHKSIILRSAQKAEYLVPDNTSRIKKRNLNSTLDYSPITPQRYFTLPPSPSLYQ